MNLRRPAGILLVILAVLALHLSVPSISEKSISWAVSRLSGSVVQRVHAVMECTHSSPVLDADGRWLGARPLHYCPRTPFLTAPVPDQAAASMHEAWVVTEGEYQVSSRHLAGLDVSGWVRTTLQYLGVSGETRTDDSNPIETALNNLTGRSARLDTSSGFRAGFEAMAYIASVLSSNTARHRFVSENTPCAIGASGSRFGPPVAGELCSYLLFNKPSTELDWPERCIWAASAKHRFQVPGPETSQAGLDVAMDREEYIRARAVSHCLEPLQNRLQWSAEELGQHVAKVQSMPLVIARAYSGRLSSSNIPCVIPGHATPFSDEPATASVLRNAEPVRSHGGGTSLRRADESATTAMRGIEIPCAM